MGTELTEVDPDTARTEFEYVAKLVKHNQKGEVVGAVCPRDTAKAILSSHVFRTRLPQVVVQTRCPILVKRGDGSLEEVTGYDPKTMAYSFGEPTENVKLDEAVGIIREILGDFSFVSENDEGRAALSIIAPAITFGRLIHGRSPILGTEADASQAGKGYLSRLIAAIYGETLGNVNAKGKGGGVDVDPRRHVIMLTSNDASMTKDLSNRTCLTKIRKQTPGYRFKEYPEGRLSQHVEANSCRYLGAVHAILKEWATRGCPGKHTDITTAFEEFYGVGEYIVTEILGMQSPTEGLLESQERAANPILGVLREVAIAVDKDGRLGEMMHASAVIDIADKHGIVLPFAPDGVPNDDSKRSGLLCTLGRKLRDIYKKAGQESLEIDEYVVRRITCKDDKGKDIRQYMFDKAGEREPEPDGLDLHGGTASENAEAEEEDVYSLFWEDQRLNGATGGQ